MANIQPTPLVMCDNCGKQDRKTKSGTEWRKPREWGHVRVAPAHWGTYPDNIDLLDLCPECNAIVHAAVCKALESAKITSGKPTEPRQA